jgi:GTP pyrophosphokinase
VDGVTKISSLNFSNDQENQVGNLRKMILAMARDVRVVLIKLCDRLHNMQTLDHLTPNRQRAIAQSTLDVYAPLANRLGMTRIRSQLEDLAMRYLFPDAFTRLAKKMAVRAQTDQQNVDLTRQILQKHLDEQKVQATIQGRRKHLYSLYQKMRNQGLRFDEVHDILAIRVICNTIQECYEILGVVHSIWKPITGRFKDYIATPKGNGYQSIHTTVIGFNHEVLEIQIRTLKMHQEAEEGIAAHWRYKENGGAPALAAVRGEEEKRLVWLRQLVDWLKDVHDPSEFMRELKHDVFEASVFCYTPKGDIVEMPRGSTALDLAYRIHTELGHHCAGVRINYRMASIRSLIQTGDIVEILSNKTAHPTTDWLQIVQTGRARNKIRHFLKESQHQEFLDQGHRTLMETVRSRFGGHVDEAQVIEILTPHLKSYSVSSYEDLLVELGCGTIKTGSLVSRLEQVLRPPAAPRRIPRMTRKMAKKKDVVLVDGVSGAVTRMALCCSPLPGEPIVGFITQGRGIAIHREDCAALARVRQRLASDQGRIVNVQWGDASRDLQKVAVRMICHDRKGLLSDITGAVTQLNVNITGSHSTTNPRDNRAIVKLIMLVRDSDELNAVLNRIAQIPGVQSLSRQIHSI